MVKEDIFPAMFKGPKKIFFGWFKIEEDTVLVRKHNKWFPFKTNFVPLISNLKKHLKQYQERFLVDLNEGTSNDVVRCYSFDIDTFEPDFADIDRHSKLLIQSLEKERDYLYYYTKELENIISLSGNKDLIKTKFKEEHTFFTSLQPQFPFKPTNKKR